MSNLSDLIPAGGGQNNTDFVADGGIASGKPVILTAAGKAAEVDETTRSNTIGAEQSLNGGVNTQGANAWAYDATNDQYLWAYGDMGDSQRVLEAINFLLFIQPILELICMAGLLLLAALLLPMGLKLR